MSLQTVVLPTVPISEVFFSISGEGTKAGTPTIFVRVAGCNFCEDIISHPCQYPCDTPYAQFRNQGTEMSIKEILGEVAKYPTKEIILTGGEPLYHQGVISLIARLNSNGYYPEIETNGSLPIWTKHLGRWSLDIKTPLSGNIEYNLYDNLRILRKKDQVKFICGTREDFDFAKMILAKYSTKATVLFQPAWNNLDAKELVEWIKKEAPFGRLSLQIQKYIYGANRRGI